MSARNVRGVAVMVLALVAAFAPRAGAVSATGGTVTNVSVGGTNYTYHIFTNSAVFTNSSLVAIDVFVVAGGGGGGGGSWYGPGGGGAGGVIFSNAHPVTVGSNYNVIVGAGGAGGAGVYNSSSPHDDGTNGNDSWFGALQAYGGGGGAKATISRQGLPGGSGGGGSDKGGGGGAATNGQGKTGGTGGPGTGSYGGGGGGGCSQIGGTGSSSAGGNGGDGTNMTWWLGSLTNRVSDRGWFAGGGVGGTWGDAGNPTKPQGGGGYNGAPNAIANTGGGGAGGRQSVPNAGNGGSGIVIVRYLADTTSPVIQNQPVTSVTTNSATFNGMLSSTGGSACAVCVYWGTDTNAWANTNWFNGGAVNSSWTNNTPFSTNITSGISADATYYYSFGASNATTNVVASGPKSFITGLVTVEATDNTAQHPSDTGQFTISRPETCTNEALTVSYTLGGTAVNGTDYAQISGSVIIPAGQATATVTITPLRLSAKTVEMTIGAGAYAVGAMNSASITILSAPGVENTATASGFWTNATIWSAGVPQFYHNVVIPAGITVTNTGLATNFINSLSITGTLTHALNSSTGEPATHKIVLDIATDLTVATGGKIDVTGKGYGSGGPGGSDKNGAGAQMPGTYGGQARHDLAISVAPTYGSVTAPVDPGSGGREGYGGGCVILTVGGTATIDGDIITEGGMPQYDDSGSGGSIFLTTGSLSGSGKLNCNGSPYTTGTSYGAGGGRMAVIVTNAAGFGNVVMTAYGNAAGAGGIYSGGAGTIYLKDTNSVYGRLVVDNSNRVTTAATLVQNQNLQFDTTAVTNGGRLDLGTNLVLDVSNNAPLLVSTNSWLVLGGGQLVFPSAYALSGNVEFRGLYTNAWTTDLTLTNGAYLTHSANGSDKAHALNLRIVGSLSMATGAQINVIGKGYGSSQGPGGSAKNGYDTHFPGAHGGQARGGSGVSVAPTYGSMIAPTDLGSGGREGAGGGCVVLNVTGQAGLDGDILAMGGVSANDDSGAGGSVYLVAGSMTGSGRINCNGSPYRVAASFYGAGGGRIAVVLTNGADFGNVVMTAYGTDASVANCDGGAGTVYLKDTNSLYGRLIVDNSNMVTTASTLITSNVTDRAVGDVVLRNGGWLRIDTNQSLTVYGSWSNAATFSAAAGGRVILTGAGPVTNTVYGTNIFAGLTCATPGMTLKFQAGGSNAVSESIILTGSLDSNLVLRSTLPGAQWKLNVQSTATTKTFDYVDVQDSDARPSFEKPTPIHYVDSGNNSNWNFSVAGQTNTWTGGSNTLWSESANWSLNAAPSILDAKALIPNGCPRYPYLGGPVTIFGELEIASDASLRTSNQTLTVNGTATIAGALIAAGTETLAFKSNLTFSGGTFTAATSTVSLAGTGAQSVAAAGITFNDLTVANTSGAVTVTGAVTARDLRVGQNTAAVAFQDAVVCRDATFDRCAAAVTFADTLGARAIYVTGHSDTITFGGAVSAASSITITNTTGTVAFGSSVSTVLLRGEAGGATLRFQAGQTVAVTNLLLHGQSGSLLALRSSSPSSRWRLNVPGWQAARWVDVQDSDASGGRKIYAIQSVTDVGGNNLNWDFGQWAIWNGTNSAVFTNAANWTSAGAPGPGSSVLIDGNYTNAPVVSVPTNIGKLVIGISSPSTLTVNTNLTVAGDVLVMSYGTITHTGPSATPTNRVSITIGGDLVVDAGGKIDVTGKGWSDGQGPGGSRYAGGDPQLPGAYGGQANHAGTISGAPTYGSITAPMDFGSGGREGAGGGSVILNVMGQARIDGDIISVGGVVSAGYDDGGSGGSVYLVAGTMAGAGRITCNGSPYTGTANVYGPGGGRMAVILTGGSDFGNVTMTAFGNAAGVNSGGAGTIYRQTAAQGAGRGTVMIDNGNLTTTARTQIPPFTNAIPDELKRVSIVVTNRGAMSVTTNATLQALTVASVNEPLNLGSSGTVLTVRSLSVNGTNYTRGGLYTTNNWNGFSPTPSNVTGAGAIQINGAGTLIMIR